MTEIKNRPGQSFACNGGEAEARLTVFAVYGGPRRNMVPAFNRHVIFFRALR